MCKISVPKTSSNLSTPTPTSPELSEEFDAWFETPMGDMPQDFEIPISYLLDSSSQSSEYKPFTFDDVLAPSPETDFYSLKSHESNDQYLPFQSPPTQFPKQYPIITPPISSTTISSLVESGAVVPPPTSRDLVVIKPYNPRKANNIKRGSVDSPISEELAIKRQKQNEGTRLNNHLAARRSREKRIEKLQGCMDQVTRAEKDKFEMAIKVAILEKEKSVWIKRETDLVRSLEQAEKQLALCMD